MQIQSVLLNLKAASIKVWARRAPVFWFVAVALVAPFALLTIGGSQANNLPWYFWVAILLVLLVVMCIGFLRFTRESHEAEDISISPDRH
jgi:peptidoglycan/LPS O-acetylase OafA/YrhL